MDIDYVFSWAMAAGIVLVVEDGTIVPGANTFITLDEYRAYAAQRGYVTPPDDAAASRAILRAGDFLRSIDTKFVGYRVSNEQTMPFPRSGVPVAGRPGWYYDDDEIPPGIKEAQIELAGIVGNGGNLYPSASSLRSVKKRKIGPIETEYFEGAVAGDWTALAPAAYAALAPFMGSLAGGLTSRRV